MRQLSELAHEYTDMGVLGPILLTGRRRGEYLLVEDTVSTVMNSFFIYIGVKPTVFQLFYVYKLFY